MNKSNTFNPEQSHNTEPTTPLDRSTKNLRNHSQQPNKTILTTTKSPKTYKNNTKTLLNNFINHARVTEKSIRPVYLEGRNDINNNKRTQIRRQREVKKDTNMMSKTFSGGFEDGGRGDNGGDQQARL
eukprot:CAMPEP_0115011590 /NCGR_PEP_ID=MMETSP0216-20121206/24119_1 /TAXON_ID=223996 /ORGANISM="Protocruzia adherens, Strain Boccale" /LENGTH=127 /DNA_ID=CAMNT_0002380259 /DNA_START=19 /DNA_END=399 /DNA_ORIENTATION=+